MCFYVCVGWGGNMTDTNFHKVIIQNGRFFRDRPYLKRLGFISTGVSPFGRLGVISDGGYYLSLKLCLGSNNAALLIVFQLTIATWRPVIRGVGVSFRSMQMERLNPRVKDVLDVSGDRLTVQGLAVHVAELYQE